MALRNTTKGSISLNTRLVDQNRIEVFITDSGQTTTKTFKTKVEEFNQTHFTRFSSSKHQEIFSERNNDLMASLRLSLSYQLSLQVSKSKDNGIQDHSDWRHNKFSFLIDDLCEENIEDMKEMESKLEIHQIETLKKFKFIDDISLNEEEYYHNLTKKTFTGSEIKHSVSSVDFSINNNEISSENQTYNKNGSGGSSKYKSFKSFTRLKTFFVSDAATYQEPTNKSHYSREMLLEKSIERIQMMMRSRRCKCPYSLIVDDNDLNILALRLILSKLYINCETSLSADEAIEKINNLKNGECCKHHKLIFLDVEMPVKDGFQALEEIKEIFLNENFMELNVIVVTAHSQNNDIVERMKSKGVRDVLSKPLSFNVLVSVLGSLIVDL